MSRPRGRPMKYPFPSLAVGETFEVVKNPALRYGLLPVLQSRWKWEKLLPGRRFEIEPTTEGMRVRRVA